MPTIMSELSPSRWAQVVRLRDDWVEAAASCGPVDRRSVEAAISSVYGAVGRPAPRFAWFDGPATATLACTLQWQLQLPGPLWPRPGRPIASVIRESGWFSRGLQGSLRALSDSLGTPLRRELGRMILGDPTGRWRAGPLGPVLGDWLRGPAGDDSALGEPGGAAEGGSLCGPLEESLLGGVPQWVEHCLDRAVAGEAGETLGTYPMWELAIPEVALLYAPRETNRAARFDGQFDADWIAFFDIPRQLGLVTYPESAGAWLNDWVTLAHSCAWWWPHENVCIVADRPSVLRTETSDTGAVRLHCAHGPAMAFRDGLAIYSWHGRVVPAWVIEEPTTQRIFHERDVEIRRCAIESMGWEAFIGDLPGLPATAPDPGNPGEQLCLYELPPMGSGWWYDVRLLVCANGTPEADGIRRISGIFVPKRIADPVSAAAWTCGLTRDEYLSLQRFE